MENNEPKPRNADSNKYWYFTYRRHNIIKEFILNTFFAISSWPRLVLEVFLRRNMGERYFTAENAVLGGIVLFVIPIYKHGGYGDALDIMWHVLKSNKTWYLFIAAYAYFSYLCWREIRNLPGVFELRRFSLSSGIPFALLLDRGYTMRRIATIVEPALTAGLGLLLLWLELPVGALLVVCSIIYSLSYFGAYSLGDDFVMDKLDEMICANNMKASFKEGKDIRDTDGFDFVGPRPENPDIRDQVLHTFWQEEEVSEVH